MRVALGNYPSNKSASSVVNPQVDEFINALVKKKITLENIASSWEDFRCLFNPTRNLIFEGLYYVHLMTWLCNFPPENILILNSEEFFENTQCSKCSYFISWSFSSEYQAGRSNHL